MSENDQESSNKNTRQPHSEGRQPSGLELNAKNQLSRLPSSTSKHQRKKLFTLIEKNKFKELQEFVAKHPYCISFLDPDDNSTPLHKAVLYGNLNIVNTLLKAGASVDSADTRGIISSDLDYKQIYF